MPERSRACEHGVSDRRSRPVDKVDDAVRQPGLLEEAHDEIRGVGGGRRGLPHDRIAHQRRRGREVAADSCEVERADGEDEALQRAVLQAVPHARRRNGLLGIDSRQVIGVEAPEVDQLGNRVDLRLVRGLRLVEHGGGVQRRAPGAGEQLSGAEENGDALLPRRPRPLGPGSGGGLDRLRHLRLAALVDVREHVRLPVRQDGLERLAGADVLAADHARDLDPLVLHRREPRLQSLALVTSPARTRVEPR